MKNIVWSDAVDAAVRGDCGAQREKNEDRFLDLTRHGVWGVADGMGGMRRGDLASEWTVSSIREQVESLYVGSDFVSYRRKLETIRQALNQANRRLLDRAEDGRGRMGSTITILALGDANPGEAVLFHAGDSRCYRFRRGSLTQVTRDHSAAAVTGKSESDLPSMFRGLVTRGVGLAEKLDLDCAIADLEAGDLFLLCTDGLYRTLSNDRIREILMNPDSTTSWGIAGNLVAAAGRAGGEDNVTVVVVRICNLQPLNQGEADPPSVQTTPGPMEISREGAEVSALRTHGTTAECVTPSSSSGSTDSGGGIEVAPDQARAAETHVAHFVRMRAWTRRAGLMALLAGCAWLGFRLGREGEKERVTEEKTPVDNASAAPHLADGCVVEAGLPEARQDLPSPVSPEEPASAQRLASKPSEPEAPCRERVTLKDEPEPSDDPAASEAPVSQALAAADTPETAKLAGGMVSDRHAAHSQKVVRTEVPPPFQLPVPAREILPEIHHAQWTEIFREQATRTPEARIQAISELRSSLMTAKVLYGERADAAPESALSDVTEPTSYILYRHRCQGKWIRRISNWIARARADFPYWGPDRANLEESRWVWVVADPEKVQEIRQALEDLGSRLDRLENWVRTLDADQPWPLLFWATRIAEIEDADRRIRDAETQLRGFLKAWTKTSYDQIDKGNAALDEAYDVATHASASPTLGRYLPIFLQLITQANRSDSRRFMVP